DPAAAAYDTMADRVATSFRARFASVDRDHLADVVDGPDGDDLRLRPNQIFAVSLPYPLLEGEAAVGVVRSVGAWLVTSYGLRSLGPTDPSYRAAYGGDVLSRDGSYHQGTVWSWIIGAFA